MDIAYELAPGPSRPGRRQRLLEHTGQKLYPAIEFSDGSWYRADSKVMAQVIYEGGLFARTRVSP